MIIVTRGAVAHRQTGVEMIEGTYSRWFSIEP